MESEAEVGLERESELCFAVESQVSPPMESVVEVNPVNPDS